MAKAACEHYSQCSGCSLQQFPYVKQIRDKTLKLRRSMQSLFPSSSPTELEALIKPIIPSPAEWGYRISSKLALDEDAEGRRSIGLYARQSKRVVDIPRCLVHHPEINQLIKLWFRGPRRLPAPFYQHRSKTFQSGKLKFLIVRYSEHSGQWGIILSHTGVERSALESWARGLALANIALYESTLKKEDEDRVVSREIKHLAGLSSITSLLGGQSFALEPSAFFQANEKLLAHFIASITEQLQGDILLDLYSGVGSYTAACLSQFKHSILVEANPQAIQAARQSFSADCQKKLLMMTQSVEEALQELKKGPLAAKVNHIIVNPPRQGLSPDVIKSLCQASWTGLQTLVYVSCDPQSLKRDLSRLLASKRYRITSIQGFDMFPQTDHLECVAKLVAVPRANPLLAAKKTGTNKVAPVSKRSAPSKTKSSRNKQTRS